MSQSSHPNQSYNLDDSHHETWYGSYTNFQGQHASERGIINNINHQTNYQQSDLAPLVQLEQHCSLSAAFDSAARFDPPRCAESTRLGIIQILEDWINSDGGTIQSSLFWLHGGAGVGKSALAQSLAEKCQEKKQLAASFFFFRSDATRNNGAALIPTLASHLIDSFDGYATFVEERIRKTRSLFAKTFQIQVQELLVDPLIALHSKGSPITHPRLVVIDGMDECKNPDIQCQLLRVIGRVIPLIPYPLRFLVISRPEAHITSVFDHDLDMLSIKVHRYNLSDDPDADMDVRRFFEKEFAEIRRVHCLGRHLPHDWPDGKAMDSLVERSSGHFIYASTVIRYIRSPKHRPDDRLEVILRLRPPQNGDQPYAQLDVLYTLIFDGVEDQSQLEKICLVLGIVYFHSNRVGFFASPLNIERWLGMKAGDLVLLLDPILSLAAINQGGEIRILHKSLLDYLLDSTRGGHLPFDLSRVHELGATYILKRRLVGDTRENELRRFAFHCRYAYLNDTLKAYLRSLDVPFITSIPESFPSWNDELNFDLQDLIWNFLATLSRMNDFDSGRAYEQYVAKWMDYLAGFPLCKAEATTPKVGGLRHWLKRKLAKTPTKSNSKSGVAAAKANDLKRELDARLTEWKPENFTPTTVEIDLIRRVNFIKREHSVFLAFAEATFSGDMDSVASSLVFGDFFIFSYNFGLQNDTAHVFLRTYSKHSNAGYKCVCSATGSIDFIVQTIIGELLRGDKHFLSDLYGKYGVRSG